MVPCLSTLVFTPFNKMVVQNENIVIFFMLSAPFSFLPLLLSAFGVRPHSLLCIPLIVFLHQLHTTNHPSSFSMVKPLTTPLFGFLVVLGLSLFLLMNEQSSSLMLVSVVSLVMVYLKRGFVTMIPFLIAFVSPVMLSFGSSESFIFTDLFLFLYPELVEDSSKSAASLDDSSPVLSLTYDPLALDPVAPPSPESPISLELRRSTRVSILPPYLTNYHCYFALATLYESHTYHEAHTDPLW